MVRRVVELDWSPTEAAARDAIRTRTLCGVGRRDADAPNLPIIGRPS